MTMRLNVYLDPEPAPIGTLVRDERGDLRFSYRAEYSGKALSMSLPLDSRAFGDRVTRAFFENLLPEGDRRADLQSMHRLQESDIAGLLAHVGHECAGAVSVIPEGGEPTKVPGDLISDYREISDAQLHADIVNLARRQRPRSPLRHSLAGVQSKMAVTIDPARPGRILETFDGGPHVPSTHILKVGDGNHPAIEANEFACLGTARALGLPTAEAEFRRLEGDGRAFLLVQRYDRSVSGGRVIRLHQEDCCQALGLISGRKYQDEPSETDQDAIFEDGVRIWSEPSLSALRSLAAFSTQPVIDVRALIRIVFFNFLIGNEDAHAKNFSFLHEEAGPRLAPFYDLVCIARYGDHADANFALWIGDCRRPDSLTRRCLLVMLSAFRVRPAAHARMLDGELRDMADTILDAFDDVVLKAPFPPVSVEAVRAILVSRIAILKEAMGW